MRIALFSARSYERALLDELNVRYGHELVYFETPLGPETTALAAGFPAVSVFVNDIVEVTTLKHLDDGGTKLVATRSTGVNHIDVQAAQILGIRVARVTEYSPNSVAEFAVGLLLALNRRIPRAYNRTREGNFSLDGLMGFDLAGRGRNWHGQDRQDLHEDHGWLRLPLARLRRPSFARIRGARRTLRRCRWDRGCRRHLAALPVDTGNPSHCQRANARRVKRGALLINTSRGGLVDTEAALEALKSGQLGGIAIDVY